MWSSSKLSSKEYRVQNKETNWEMRNDLDTIQNESQSRGGGINQQIGEKRFSFILYKHIPILKTVLWKS